MNRLFSLVVVTSNILGSLNDPFEFAGNYGSEINSVREYVFDQVVSKEALAINLTDDEVVQMMAKENSFHKIEDFRKELVAKAIQKDLQHGPTLSELVSPELINQLVEIKDAQSEIKLSQQDFDAIVNFIEKYKDQRVFSLLRHIPSEFLSLDKILRDKAAREGKNFDLPILSSTELLQGEDAFQLKVNLFNTLFKEEILNVVSPFEKLNKAIHQLDNNYLQEYLGADAQNKDLLAFTTPFGQVFFYWLYQALNLHLISENEAMISEINQVKANFAKGIGNSKERAITFKDKLIDAEVSVLFTQESDAIVPQLLTEEGLFHSVELQNSSDGTLVFLKGKDWEPSYKVISIDDYEGYSKGRMNVILATLKQTGEKFLLAAGHGNSTRAEDGRLQIIKVVEKYNELSKLPENKNLQLVIGIDANTKTDEDVQLLRDLLNDCGLIGTDVGVTTVKKRMVTAQHSKAGRIAIDEEDYIITLKLEHGGFYQMIDPMIGFKKDKPDPLIPLPNIENPSDHYSIGVVLQNTVEN